MSNGHKGNSGFVKPDANEYRERRANKDKLEKKSKQKPKKGNISQPSNRNRDFIHRQENNEIDPSERRKNIVFTISVITFLIVLIITKKFYADMQNQEMEKLSKNKWFVSAQEDIDKVGYLEIKFGNKGTFDMYKADTQITCMNGKYTVGLGGYITLKSDDRGFNPPGEWKCKKNSTFKYEFKDSKLLLTYKGVKVTFNKQGESEENNEVDADVEKLSKKYFVNEQAKMLVTFYMNNMFIYKLNDLKRVFGENGEVLGEICFSGEYKIDSGKSMITVDARKDDYIVTSNPMWEDMTEYKTYDILYKLEDDFSKIALQYNNKAYEFKKIVMSE